MTNYKVDFFDEILMVGEIQYEMKFSIINEIQKLFLAWEKEMRVLKGEREKIKKGGRDFYMS